MIVPYSVHLEVGSEAIHAYSVQPEVGSEAIHDRALLCTSRGRL